MARSKKKPCPGCKRDRQDCWIMPCLYLEIIIARGPAAVARWARPGGGRVVKKSGILKHVEQTP